MEWRGDDVNDFRSVSTKLFKEAKTRKPVGQMQTLSGHGRLFDIGLIILPWQTVQFV